MISWKSRYVEEHISSKTDSDLVIKHCCNCIYWGCWYENCVVLTGFSWCQWPDLECVQDILCQSFIAERKYLAPTTHNGNISQIFCIFWFMISHVLIFETWSPLTLSWKSPNGNVLSLTATSSSFQSHYGISLPFLVEHKNSLSFFRHKLWILTWLTCNAWKLSFL